MLNQSNKYCPQCLHTTQYTRLSQSLTFILETVYLGIEANREMQNSNGTVDGSGDIRRCYYSVIIVDLLPPSILRVAHIRE